MNSADKQTKLIRAWPQKDHDLAGHFYSELKFWIFLCGVNNSRTEQVYHSPSERWKKFFSNLVEGHLIAWKLYIWILYRVIKSSATCWTSVRCVKTKIFETTSRFCGAAEIDEHVLDVWERGAHSRAISDFDLVHFCLLRCFHLPVLWLEPRRTAL